MTITQKISQLAWNAGEIADDRKGRIDLAKYAMAADYIVNFMVREAGELERTPGFQFIGAVKDHAKPPRLMDFVYNDVQAYIVELGDLYGRFYMLGGQLTKDDAPYEIVTPWKVEDVFRLQVAQRSDVAFVAGGARGYRMQQLARTAHTSWTCTDFASDTGPFMDPNNTATTVTPSATTGAITLASSAPLWSASHVGALWRIEEDTFSGYSMWEPAKTYANGDVVRHAGNVYQQVSGGSKTSGAVAPVHTTGQRYDGQAANACLWQYLHSGYGVVRITSHTDSQLVNATVLSRLPSTAAVTTWREGAWSDYRGHPVTVALAGQRLWALGNRAQPRTVWGSVGGDPFDFTPGSAADDAVTLTLESIESNPIRAAAEQGGVLFAITSKRVYRITGTNGGPIKPDDRQAVAVSGVGSNGVQPVNVGRAILFVDQTSKRLQELAFAVEADTDAAKNLSRMASHLLTPGG